MIYAINKRTKEHLVCEDGVTLDGIGWRFVETDADGWIEWNGGECPLPDGTHCEYKMRPAGRAKTVRGSEYLDWSHEGGSAEIVAYRPILNADEPAEPEAVEWVEEKKMIYAINKRTKEHRVWNPKKGPLSIEEVVCHADADGWIEWGGGECPLADGAPFQYKMRSHLAGGHVTARSPEDLRWADLRWAHEGRASDIIAYRPILNAEPSEPEAPEWDGEGLPPVGCECDCYHTGTYQGVVTVRYMGSEMCVLLNHDHGEEQCGPIDAYSFRPLHTPAQRAEESMAEAWSDAEQAASCGFKAIYRAIRDGKVPGVKLEGDK